MRQFYDTISFILFVIGLVFSFVAFVFGILTVAFPADAPLAFGYYPFLFVLFVLLGGIGWVWKDDPPIESTEWLLNKLGYNKYLAWKLERTLKKYEWKYRIGDELKVWLWCDKNALVRVIGYNHPELKRRSNYYICRIIKCIEHRMIGAVDEFSESRLEPQYKFTTDNHKEMFGYISTELRKNGVLKTKAQNI
jgi:energy-coupling factor transporter transmembrane protein EcfT